MEKLDKEFQYYIDNQEELVKKYNGKYLVIKDNAIIGAYDNQTDAYMEGEKKCGLGNFLIQLCSPGKEAYTITFYTHRVNFA